MQTQCYCHHGNAQYCDRQYSQKGRESPMKWWFFCLFNHLHGVSQPLMVYISSENTPAWLNWNSRR